MNKQDQMIAVFSIIFILIVGAFGGFILGMLIGGLIGFPALFGMGAGMPSGALLFTLLGVIATAVYIKKQANNKHIPKKPKKKQSVSEGGTKNTNKPKKKLKR